MLTSHDCFWQDKRSIYLSWEEEDALLSNDSTLSNSNADMLAILDRYKKHHLDVCRAHNQMLRLSPFPIVEEYSETEDLFMEQDRLNQKRINEQIRTNSMPEALGQYNNIYGQGLPFELLFFEARQRLDDTVRELARDSKRQEFNAEISPAYDDFNFF
jgi:hypothetical protein